MGRVGLESETGLRGVPLLVPLRVEGVRAAA